MSIINSRLEVGNVRIILRDIKSINADSIIVKKVTKKITIIESASIRT